MLRTLTVDEILDEADTSHCGISQEYASILAAEVRRQRDEIERARVLLSDVLQMVQGALEISSP